LTDQYQEASQHLWELLEGKDKPVAGTTCMSKGVFKLQSETSFVLPERKLSVILLDVTCKLVLSIFKCLYNFLHWFGATIVLPFISLYSYLTVVANESEENGSFSHCTIW